MVILLSGGQDRGGIAGIDNGGNAELPGHRGQVAGDAADVGDQTFKAADEGGIIGRGGPGDQNGIFRQMGRVETGGKTDGADGNPRGSGLPWDRSRGYASRSMSTGTVSDLNWTRPRGRLCRINSCPCRSRAHSTSWGFWK